ncbi:FxsA family protein [Rhizobium sp. BK251]|uniref:FxsA family protein n=1 Tax=Rhizobium sp. BK251 TaxID=2512125 RepID=UPI001049426C|nr:FxsA family protein [Rhizobium sp. BK251]TCL73087.1 UPF0716 protein FxsA [Rhizobium sp. BK251]
MRFSLFPIAVMLMPLAEIAGFVIVGRAVGLWATLGLVILSVFVGIALLRLQGPGILRRIAVESRNGAVPGRDIIHGAMIVIAAFLLIIPGFLSDILGILLFIPLVRDLAWKHLSRRIVILGSAGPFGNAAQCGPASREGGSGPVVDLDESDYHREANKKNSPWSDRKQIED